MTDQTNTESTSENTAEKKPGHDFGAKIRAFVNEHTSGYEFVTKTLYDELAPTGEQVLRSKISHILSRMRKSGTLKMPKKGHWTIN